MNQKDPDETIDTRLNMSEVEDDKHESVYKKLNFLSDGEIAALDKDVKEPSSLARDILMEQYRNNMPRLMDFGDATNLIMNTSKYTERIEGLLKYEYYLFLNQRSGSVEYSNDYMSSRINNEGDMKSSESWCNIGYTIFDDPLRTVYGPNLLIMLTNIIDTVEGKDKGEEDGEYKLRRNQTAIEFINSFYHLKNYLHKLKDSKKSFIQNVETWLLECVQEGNKLMKQSEFKTAADKYLDGAFACMCILHQENDNTINILSTLLKSTVDEEAIETNSIESFATSDTESVTKSDASFESSDNENNGIIEDNKTRLYICVLDIKIKVIKCLIEDMQLQRASRYTNHLMRWMCEKEANGSAGYYLINYTNKYCQLQSFIGRAEYLQGNIKCAITRSTNAIEHYLELGHNLVNFEITMFEERKKVFELLAYDFQQDKATSCSNANFMLLKNYSASDEYRSRAKIIVDIQREKGLINDKTQFVVNDIDTALRIAKDGDTIFLEEGAYMGGKCGEKKNKSKEQIIELNKNVEIVGAQTSRVHLIGSVVKRSQGRVIFRNLTFENSIASGSNGSIYAMSGTTVISDCCIKSSNNTAIYVISNDALHNTSLELDYCVMDGMNICERILGFEGLRPAISVKNCYVCNALSFCVVFSPEILNCTVEMTIMNSLFISVQDGIKIIVHHESLVPPKTIIRGCHFELAAHRTNDGSPSIAFCQTAGMAKLENNYINMLEHNVPTTGFSLHSLTLAQITMNMITSTGESSRQYSVSKGILITECKKTEIKSTEIEGMRVGIKFANKIENEINTARIENCSMKCCSLGLLISKSSNYGESIQQNENCHKFKTSLERKTKHKNKVKGDTEDGNILVSNPTKLCELISKQVEDYIEPNMYLKMTGCLFNTLYYGVMNETPRGQICLAENTFVNVAKAVILYHDCLDTYQVELYLNAFRLTDMFDYSDIDFHDSIQVENLRKNMYIHFTLNKNIPCRIAYEEKDYFVVSSKFDESFLFENNLASSVVVSDGDQSPDKEKDKSNYKGMI